MFEVREHNFVFIVNSRNLQSNMFLLFPFSFKIVDYYGFDVYK